MESLIHDLRYGLRSLRKSPTFAGVATLTLALAIGVNTAIFSIVSVVIFADLPMRDAETVAVVRGVNPELGVERGAVSVPDFLDLSERAESFESLAAVTEDRWVLTGLDRPQRVTGYKATANILRQWRLPPVLGRDFAEGEDRAGADRVVMLSYPFWQSQFGGSRDVLGRTLRLDGIEHTIVGVMSEEIGFADFGDADVWVPFSLTRDGGERDARELFVTGRLREGVSHERATEEVAAIARALESEHPDANAGWDLWSAPVLDSLINDEGWTILTLLVLMVGFVVLIACANIANMLLARGTARAREMAVRAALGAGRGRLIRQLLTESFVVSLGAAGLGLLFAKGLLEALIRISNGQEQVFLMAEMDGRVLGFTLLVSLVAPLLFGLFPALRASDGDASATLRDGRGSDGGRSGKRARGVLVGAQIALAVTLMVVAGLLVRSIYNLQQREMGFDPRGLVAVELDLPENEYPDEESRRQFYDRVVDEVEAIPSVRGAALLNAIPGADFGARRGIEIEGRPLPEDRAHPAVFGVTVSPETFDVMGVPIVAGRAFSAADGPDGVPVAILSKEVADRHWPDDDPIGRRIRIGAGEEEWLRVVGVAGDVRSTTDSERPAPNVYLPYAQSSASASYVLARTPRGAAAPAGALRSAVWTVDPNQPIDRVVTVPQAQYDNRASTYALLSLFVIFAAFALFMAGIGVYGVMAYTVSQRRAEIGLRMALGAEVSAVRRMVVGQGMRVLVLGVGAGLAAAFLLSRTLSGIVFGITTTDPLTYVGVPLVLGAVAVLANLVPAVRASRTDPVQALRAE